MGIRYWYSVINRIIEGGKGEYNSIGSDWHYDDPEDIG
jgi:hypothetical protein